MYLYYKVFPSKINCSVNTLCKSGDRILIIAPHADDELLSSYSILSRTDCDVWVYYCGFTGLYKDSNSRMIRYNEIAQLCSSLNVSFVDGKGQDSQLHDFLENNLFDKILIPSLVDWNFEHRKISCLLINSLQKMKTMPQIYWYSITVPIETSETLQYMLMNRVEQRKKYLLFKRIYRSQSFMPIHRFKINERINGHNIKHYAAETFMPISYEQLVYSVNRLEKDENLIQILNGTKYQINNIILVRRISEKIYTSFTYDWNK